MGQTIMYFFSMVHTVISQNPRN